MNFSATDLDGVRILQLFDGDRSEDHERPYQDLLEAITASRGPVVVDASGALFIRAALVSCLMRGNALLRRYGWGLVVCGLPRYLMKVLDTLELRRALRCCETLEEALLSVRSVRSLTLEFGHGDAVSVAFLRGDRKAAAGGRELVAELVRLDDGALTLRWDNDTRRDVDALFAPGTQLLLRIGCPSWDASAGVLATARVDVAACEVDSNVVAISARLTDVLADGDDLAGGGVGAGLPPHLPGDSAAAAKDIPRDED